MSRDREEAAELLARALKGRRWPPPVVATLQAS
jgi:hypothetical protein